MTDVPQRLLRRLKREAAPLVSAGRSTQQAKDARRAIERLRMRAKATKTPPDELLDQIVSRAVDG